MMIAIDPGITGTGVAIYYGRESKLWGVAEPPAYVCNIYPAHREGTEVTWQDRMTHVAAQVKWLFDFSGFVFSECVCEFPDYWTGDAKGQAAAVNGDIMKLAALVGAILHMASERNIPVTLVSPRVWKGQLPKEAVEYRIRKMLGAEATKDYKSHTWDAVGIGLWAKGVRYEAKL
jgi:hypothetical protein